MYEVTFDLNSFGETIIHDGVNTIAVRILNVLINRKYMLPNNADAYADIKQYLMEYANNDVLDGIRIDLLNKIKSYVPEAGATAINIEVSPTKNSDSTLKNIFIEVKIGSNSSSNKSIVYAFDYTKSNEVEFRTASFL